MIIPKALLMTFIASIFIFSMANISYQQVELPFTDDVEGDGGEEEEGSNRRRRRRRRRRRSSNRRRRRRRRRSNRSMY